MIKVQYFSENYICLMPDEVQSLHWSQTQVTLFPVVTFRKDINGNLLEVHFDINGNLLEVHFVHILGN